MTIEEMKERKKELGYSCEELARLSGLPYATVQKVFSGITASPRRKTILALEKVLKKEDSYLDSMGQLEESPILFVRDEGTAYNAGSESRPPQDKCDGKGPYTIDDYYALPDEKRAELIDGYFYEMLAPSAIHQQLQLLISVRLYQYITDNNGKCKIFTAPFDVKLDEDDKTMVQPDILIICKKDKLTKQRLEGSPDMVIEILSPSTAIKDHTTKLRKYKEAGVREYWIVDPEKEMVIVYFTDEKNQIITTIYGFDAKVPVNIWDGKCMIDLRDIKTEIQDLY